MQPWQCCSSYKLGFPYITEQPHIVTRVTACPVSTKFFPQFCTHHSASCRRQPTHSTFNPSPTSRPLPWKPLLRAAHQKKYFLPRPHPRGDSFASDSLQRISVINLRRLRCAAARQSSPIPSLALRSRLFPTRSKYGTARLAARRSAPWHAPIVTKAGISTPGRAEWRDGGLLGKWMVHSGRMMPTMVSRGLEKSVETRGGEKARKGKEEGEGEKDEGVPGWQRQGHSKGDDNSAGVIVLVTYSSSVRFEKKDITVGAF
jgi:hypothetical protein